jgi:CRP-like cAMP-binding protein
METHRSGTPIHVEQSRFNSPAITNQWVASAQGSPLFSKLPAADCAYVVACARKQHFPRRQAIWLEGDPIRSVMLLIAGSVKTVRTNQDGCEVIVRLNGPGDMVGPLGICTRGTHCATARAVIASDVLVWERAAFERILDVYPPLRRNTIGMLESYLQDMDERFRELCSERVSLRLSSQMVRLAKQIGSGANGLVEIGLSREELAQLIGTTLFTVSRLLCRWQTMGILSCRREAVIVRNLQALMQLSEESESQATSGTPSNGRPERSA